MLQLIMKKQMLMKTPSDELMDIPEILESDAVLGPSDIMCRIVAPTCNDITEVITKKIRKIDNIINTTLNVINGQNFRR